MFRIGESNVYVNTGDTVWADILVAHRVAPGIPPVVSREAVSGVVLDDGNVVLQDGTIIQLRVCRLCKEVIRLDP